MDLKAPGWVTEFRGFIMRGNVVDLAVGIIIGAAFTGVCQQPGEGRVQPVARPADRRRGLLQCVLGAQRPALRVAGRCPACRCADAQFRPVHQRHHPVHHRRLRRVLGGEGADQAARARRCPTAGPKPEELLAEIRDILKEKLPDPRIARPTPDHATQLPARRRRSRHVAPQRGGGAPTGRGRVAAHRLQRRRGRHHHRPTHRQRAVRLPLRQPAAHPHHRRRRAHAASARTGAHRARDAGVRAGRWRQQCRLYRRLPRRRDCRGEGDVPAASPSLACTTATTAAATRIS